MKWFPEYIPVKNPAEDKKGWNYPYNGDDWPEKNDWYWVWAGSKNHPEPYNSTLPKRAWWDNNKQRFLAIEGDVYAWRIAKVKTNNPRINRPAEGSLFVV